MTCRMVSVWQNPGASEQQTGSRRVSESSSTYFDSTHVAEFTRWMYLNLLPVNIKSSGRECGLTVTVRNTHFCANVERMESVRGMEATVKCLL